MEGPLPPSHVAVIGGGRWARVLTGELCKLLPPGAEVSVHSRSNAAGMAAWAEDRGLSERVRISSVWPRLSGGSVGAVLVANAARDHVEAALAAIDAGVPVLLEKPLAPTGMDARRLLERAQARGSRLAASQVFRFARYVDRFAKLVQGAGALESLDFRWSDPLAEERHGERTTHDESLPVFADVLPHAAAITHAVAGRVPGSCQKAAASRNGACVELELALGKVPVRARLARGEERRERLVRVEAGGRELTLDFSVEPGTLSWSGRSENGDPDWNSQPRPVASMLAAFLAWGAGGPADARLDPAAGLQACLLSDQTAALLR